MRRETIASPASESKPNVAKTTPVSCPVFGNKRPTTDLLESLEFEEELEEELELDEEVELEEFEDELLEDELDELLELEDELLELLELEDELLELEDGLVVLGEVDPSVPGLL